ncbi:MAG: CHASE3 domain-containing protein, partial [Desulfobulbaceae bacterium]|nr:CHASE3 domain-containing protein [Desulfobulbaceae bacterium]
MEKLALKTKMLLGNCAPLVLLIILSIITYNSIGLLLKSNNWVDHTHEVIASAKSIEAAAVDMETGMRGYLLAGKEEFLDPYKNGQKRFVEQIAKLQKTVDDNPAQVELLNNTRDNIREWQEKVTEPTISLRGEIAKSKTMDDMRDLVGEAKGKVYFDKFRGQIQTFVDRERALMQKRKDAAKRSDNVKELK